MEAYGNNFYGFSTHSLGHLSKFLESPIHPTPCRKTINNTTQSDNSRPSQLMLIRDSKRTSEQQSPLPISHKMLEAML